MSKVAAKLNLRQVGRVCVTIADTDRAIDFYVDTLEYLRRGGRIGAAQALLGTALAVKPLLTINAGRIVPLEKVRTSSRAIARLADIAVQRAGDTPVQLAVHHLANLEKAQTLADNLSDRLPHAEEVEHGSRRRPAFRMRPVVRALGAGGRRHQQGQHGYP